LSDLLSGRINLREVFHYRAIRHKEWHIFRFRGMGENPNKPNKINEAPECFW
jgi:hypothetical protein